MLWIYRHIQARQLSCPVLTCTINMATRPCCQRRLLLCVHQSIKSKCDFIYFALKYHSKNQPLCKIQDFMYDLRLGHNLDKMLFWKLEPTLCPAHNITEVMNLKFTQDDIIDVLLPLTIWLIRMCQPHGRCIIGVWSMYSPHKLLI